MLINCRNKLLSWFFIGTDFLHDLIFLVIIRACCITDNIRVISFFYLHKINKILAIVLVKSSKIIKYLFFIIDKLLSKL